MFFWGYHSRVFEFTADRAMLPVVFNQRADFLRVFFPEISLRNDRNVFACDQIDVRAEYLFRWVK